MAFLYYLLKAYSPVNSTGSSQGFSKVEYNTKHAYFATAKHTNIIRKLIPLVLLDHKKWQIKLGDAGTIDRIGLVFEYQITNIIKKNGQKQSQI